MDWQTQDDLRTLRRACEIVNDKTRMKHVRDMIDDEKEALEELGNIEGLRKDKY